MTPTRDELTAAIQTARHIQDMVRRGNRPKGRVFYDAFIFADRFALLCECVLEAMPAEEKDDPVSAKRPAPEDEWMSDPTHPTHPNHERQVKGLQVIDCQYPCQNPPCKYANPSNHKPPCLQECALGNKWEAARHSAFLRSDDKPERDTIVEEQRL